jgi:hypothetical protein
LVNVVVELTVAACHLPWRSFSLTWRRARLFMLSSTLSDPFATKFGPQAD